MRKLFVILLVALCWMNLAVPAFAATGSSVANTHLVPCKESAAFQERMQSAPQYYYFDQPYQAYSANLFCGADGLPHLQLRLDRAVDVAIPFALFFYVAGFIGWSGRAYLISGKRASKPEETEIFIDVGLALAACFQGVLWPLLAIKEVTTGELTASSSEVTVSPR